MDLLVAQGKVVYVGSSNFAGWHIAAACEAARRRNGLGLVSEQSKYSLLERTVELEVVPACQSYGLGLIPWSPLGSGALAGKSRASGQGGRREGTWGKQTLDNNRERIDAFVQLCANLGEEPANVALAWLLHNPAVTAPIIGPRTIDQLDGALKAADLKLESSTLRRLDELFPGPGKPAPEAYAW
jgi:NDP-hexose 2,3-enoyl reductase